MPTAPATVLAVARRLLLDAADHQDPTLLSIARRLSERYQHGGETLSRIIFNPNPRIAPPHFMQDPGMERLSNLIDRNLYHRQPQEESRRQTAASG